MKSNKQSLYVFPIADYVAFWCAELYHLNRCIV
jgi:hypothetical protein